MWAKNLDKFSRSKTRKSRLQASTRVTQAVTNITNRRGFVKSSKTEKWQIELGRGINANKKRSIKIFFSPNPRNTRKNRSKNQNNPKNISHSKPTCINIHPIPFTTRQCILMQIWRRARCRGEKQWWGTLRCHKSHRSRCIFLQLRPTLPC